MKFPHCLFISLALAVASPAANILWVSDMFPVGSGTSDNAGSGTAGVFGSGPGPYPDQGVISLLTGAGHTVSRFNPSDSTPLTAAEVGMMNTYDLLIITRSSGSVN